MMAGKVFSDALIRRLNEACEEIKGSFKGCPFECSGIGWCHDCWIMESEKEEERDKRRERRLHDDTL